jgi:glucan endo-1,6-beta-glucosidase
VQFMNSKWGSGDPNAALPADRTATAYDDHHYIKYVGLPNSKDAYLNEACTTDRSGNDGGPVYVGEWSLSVGNDFEGTDEWKPEGSNIDWYKKFWAAQILSYEKTAGGWIFWSWTTSGLNDPRWDYKMAVERGIIGKDPAKAQDAGAC